jgi:hypothetical protein
VQAANNQTSPTTFYSKDALRYQKHCRAILPSTEKTPILLDCMPVVKSIAALSASEPTGSRPNFGKMFAKKVVCFS